ncbi:YqgE/AlgH family protein [Monaibacterium marinum]|nr:YqgE/AlgH family protein [Monaibacterium marinum]
MTHSQNHSPFLDGTLLVASPAMPDPRFAGAVVFLCTHSDQGAMGLVINHVADGVEFADLAEQLDVETPYTIPELPVMVGGPVERTRGFVLHSPDYALKRATLDVTDWCSMTNNVAILRELLGGYGPEQAMLALGYSSWGPGQLEEELGGSSWLNVTASPELMFETPADDIWDRCLASIGVNPAMLHSISGNA